MLDASTTSTSTAGITSSTDAPVVVVCCTQHNGAGHDRASGVHERRVLRRASLAHACDTTEALAHEPADATLDAGAWTYAAAFLMFGLEVARSWLAAAWTAEQPLPLFPTGVMPDTAVDAQRDLVVVRNAFETDTPQWRVLHELFHACCALESFGRSRRRGLLDEVFLRVHRATRVMREHDPRGDARIDSWWHDFRWSWT